MVPVHRVTILLDLLLRILLFFTDVLLHIIPTKPLHQQPPTRFLLNLPFLHLFLLPILSHYLFHQLSVYNFHFGILKNYHGALAKVDCVEMVESG